MALAHPKYGTSAWRKASTTRGEDAVAWVGTYTTGAKVRDAWEKVLTWRQAAGGNGLSVNVRIAKDSNLPLGVRQVSALRLLAHHPDQVDSWGWGYHLVKFGTDEYVVTHLRSPAADLHAPHPVMRRDPLTPRVLDALIETRARLLEPGVHPNIDMLSDHRFSLWLATCEQAAPEHLAFAVDLSRRSMYNEAAHRVIETLACDGAAAAGAVMSPHMVENPPVGPPALADHARPDPPRVRPRFVRAAQRPRHLSMPRPSSYRLCRCPRFVGVVPRSSSRIATTEASRVSPHAERCCRSPRVVPERVVMWVPVAGLVPHTDWLVPAPVDAVTPTVTATHAHAMGDADLVSSPQACSASAGRALTVHQHDDQDTPGG